MAAPLPTTAQPACISTNTVLVAAGYTTAPSASYGMKLVLKDGEPVGHFDCQTAWSLPGMREAEVEAASILADLESLIASTIAGGATV